MMAGVEEQPHYQKHQPSEHYDYREANPPGKAWRAKHVQFFPFDLDFGHDLPHPLKAWESIWLSPNSKRKKRASQFQWHSLRNSLLESARSRSPIRPKNAPKRNPI